MSTNNSYVTFVEVSGFKKISKNYAYTIQTTWSDGMKFELYRRYGDFFTFQDLLLKMFPKEAGKNDSRERKIPYLPTVDNVFKLFGRTNSESVMQSRLQTINYYCKTVLIDLGEHITRSSVVLDFFRPTPNDKQMKRLGRPATLHPQKIPTGTQWEDFELLADYDAEPGKSNQLTAKAKDKVTVMKNDDSGWSFCTKASTGEVGWIPTAFLKKVEEEIELGFMAPQSILGHPRTESIIEGEESLEKYCAICEYEVEDSSQLSFPKGAIITVIDKDEDGWWFVSYQDKEGWAPSSYLEPSTGHSSLTAEDLDEVYAQENGVVDEAITSQREIFYAKCEYSADLEDELSFPKGAEIEIINKSISGWWTGRFDGKLGLVPATFLSNKSTEVEEQKISQASNSISQTESQSVSLLGLSTTSSGKFQSVGGSKFERPPPRRKTVRHTVMQQRHQFK